jgi:hypothetical protein
MELVSDTDKAAMHLEGELELIKDKFENGEMKAFGMIHPNAIE